MYKIIGADNKEYGPITLEQMRQWLAEGRVNTQTLVWSETSNNWKPLAAYPELAPAGAIPGAPPAFAGMPTSDRSAALSKVSGPAIGLMIAGGLGVLFSIAGIAMHFLGVGLGALSGQPPEVQKLASLWTGASVVSAFVQALGSVFVLYGGMQMKRLKNLGLCKAANIVAMVPCISGCCIIGLPVGIFGLIALSKPEVKSHFES